MHTPINLVVLGPPGAGKGTQAVEFAQRHGVSKISTGDILREAVQSGTALGQRAKATMDAGGLVDDELMIAIVRERLNRDDVKPGFVLDGFPRTVTQATALDEIMTGHGSLVIVDISVPDDALVARLARRRVCGQCGRATSMDPTAKALCEQCGGELVLRSDDTESVVRERLRVYAEATRPLVDYYSSRPTFRAVDGGQSPTAVGAALSAAVDAILAGLPAGTVIPEEAGA
ncbi:MAG: adenylate kinase [Acidobacteriota bacterium]|nr:adenylate kinase [Acidobacteriota bacterium]